MRNPSPHQYVIRSEFDDKHYNKSRAFTFGQSRDLFRKVYIKESK